MINIKEAMVTKDKIIKTLAFLKVQKYLDLVNDGEFVEKVLDIYRDEYYCESVERLSHIAFDEIVRRIEEIKEKRFGFEVLFNEEVSIVSNGYEADKVCDVILLSNNSIEVIKVMSRETDIINAYDSSEMKLLGKGVIDRFLLDTSSDEINLTIIQPNLLITTIFQIGIGSLLHQCEYSLV